MEGFAYNLRNSITDEKLASKLSASDKDSLEKAINETLAWLDANQEGTVEEYEHHQKELERISNPIMTKLYQGAGGMPQGGMPDFGAAAGAGAHAGDQSGPTIEEVD